MSELTPEQRIEMDEHDYGVSGLRGPDNRELYIIDPDREKVGYPHGALIRHPGAMYRWPEHDVDGRECWVVVLPNRAGAWWTTYKSDDGASCLWEVSGMPPKLTVHPSINAGDGPGPGNWHGWIKDGALTP